jgi:hypothetical protein
MRATKRNQPAAQNGQTNAQKRQAVLAFLNHPTLSLLSDRDISRRTRVSQPIVSKLRKAIISQESGIPATSLITSADGTGVGRGEAIFDASALNSYAWVTAGPREQSRFVDAVGLQKLYEAAPPDHRDAFVARLLAQLSPADRPQRLPTNIEMYLDRIEPRPSGDSLDIPPHRRRPRSEVG